MLFRSLECQCVGGRGRFKERHERTEVSQRTPILLQWVFISDTLITFLRFIYSEEAFIQRDIQIVCVETTDNQGSEVFIQTSFRSFSALCESSLSLPLSLFVLNHLFFFLYFLSDMTRHPSTDSTPSESGSTPSDSGSSPSPSTPQKLLPTCTSAFGPRLVRAMPSSSATSRPQPEGSDHRHGNIPRLSGKFGGHGPCGHRVPVKMERIKVCVYVYLGVYVYSNTYSNLL